jgi:hypothetical protein
MTIRDMAVCVVMPCSFVDRCKLFRGICNLNLKGGRGDSTKLHSVVSWKTIILIPTIMITSYHTNVDLVSTWRRWCWPLRYILTFVWKDNMKCDLCVIWQLCSRDSVVNIATGYGLDDQGVRVRVPVGLRIFSTSSRPALRSTQPPVQWVLRTLSSRVKRLGREADHSPPTSAGVKKKNMDLYIHSPMCLHGIVLNYLNTGQLYLFTFMHFTGYVAWIRSDDSYV